MEPVSVELVVWAPAALAKAAVMAKAAKALMEFR
jgi:hypothetical protein